jgi:cell division cycle 20-like protein 1 (cofactor of APC complex)
MSFNKPSNAHTVNNHHKHDLTRADQPLPRTRKISKKPYKILDAPNLQDDFYLNLLDWSDKNQIAVALDSSLYLWSGCSSEITRLY